MCNAGYSAPNGYATEFRPCIVTSHSKTRFLVPTIRDSTLIVGRWIAPYLLSVWQHASSMARFFYLCCAIIGIACCLALSGCASGTVGNAAPMTPATTTTIDYQRSGGIVGLQDHLTIAQDGTASLTRRTRTVTFTVDVTAVTTLTNTLDAIPFSALDDQYLPANAGADQITYTLQYQSKTVRMVDSTIPVSLIPVVELLDGIILDQKNP